MNKIIIVSVVFSLFLFSGCVWFDPPVLVQVAGSTIANANQVKVDSNDTTAAFLFSKLSAGTNITLAVQNSGANEKVLISAPSGASGRTYTSGTPGTIEVNNDTNTISQNFDGNFFSRINGLDLNNSLSYSKVNCDNNSNCTFTGKITTTRDANFNNIKFNGTLSGGDFNYSLSDANGTQSCPAGQALQVIGSTVTCISISSGSGRTYTSGTPATIEVNNDLNTISQNFDGNFSSRFNNAFDGNFVLIFKPSFDSNFQKSFDGNFQSSFDGNYYARNALLFPVPDANVLNQVRYKQDASCDSNLSCTTTNKITTVADANFLNIRFNGTLSGGDFNYSLSDANGTQTCPAGQALQTVGSSSACIVVSSGVDRNIVAVSGTDTNAGFLGQKLVSGAYTSFTTLNSGANEKIRINSSTCDNNVDCTFTGTAGAYVLKAGDTMSGPLTMDSSGNAPMFQVSESGGNDIFTVNTDGSPSTIQDLNPFADNTYSLGDSTHIWRNFYASNANLRATSVTSLTASASSTFAANLTVNGTISGGDFNYSLGDANDNQTCPAGQALKTVGNTTTCVIIPPVIGSCDNNASCTITGKITTIKDANFQNIRFNGTLSGGDFNYSLSDANGSQSCATGQHLTSVGATSTCVADFNAVDGNALYLKLNPTASQTVHNLTFDLNIDNNSSGEPTLNLNNLNGGDNYNLAFAHNGCRMATMGLTLGGYFGFFAYAPCAPNGVFTGYDVSHFINVTPSGSATQIVNTDGLAITANTTNTGTLHVTSTVTADANVNAKDVNVSDVVYANKIGSKTDVQADRNVNALDINVSNRVNTTNLAVNGFINTSLVPDINFDKNIGSQANYLNTVFTQTIYVDTNIYARTFDTNQLGVVALNTCYTNNSPRDLFIYGDATFTTVLAGDIALLGVQSGGGCSSLYSKQTMGKSSVGVVNDATQMGYGILVPSKFSYKFLATISGSGSVKMGKAQVYYP